MPSVEVINNASFIVILPLTFVSNAFVPLAVVPGGLRTFVGVEPGLGGHPGVPRAVRQHRRRPPDSDAWSMQNPVLYTLIWVVIILAVFVPLSVRQYRIASTR